MDEVCGQLEMIEKKKGARIDASISFAIKKGVVSREDIDINPKKKKIKQTNEN